ncbi:hypothetical protein LX36DRAFT_210325 [Colletotrichum falcatum]|nr:hypothetical protein LX36DRAFT_210325 [Colletotrichum falcatum]
MPTWGDACAEEKLYNGISRGLGGMHAALPAYPGHLAISTRLEYRSIFLLSLSIAGSNWVWILGLKEYYVTIHLSLSTRQELHAKRGQMRSAGGEGGQWDIIGPYRLSMKTRGMARPNESLKWASRRSRHSPARPKSSVEALGGSCWTLDNCPCRRRPLSLRTVRSRRRQMWLVLDDVSNVSREPTPTHAHAYLGTCTSVHNIGRHQPNGFNPPRWFGKRRR